MRCDGGGAGADQGARRCAFLSSLGTYCRYRGTVSARVPACLPACLSCIHAVYLVTRGGGSPIHPLIYPLHFAFAPVGFVDISLVLPAAAGGRMPASEMTM